LTDPLVAVLPGDQREDAIYVGPQSDWDEILPFSKMSPNNFTAADDLSRYLSVQLRPQSAQPALGSAGIIARGVLRGSGRRLRVKSKSLGEAAKSIERSCPDCGHVSGNAVGGSRR